jgi:hypothetical protein
MSWTWLTGKMSREEARAQHPLWLSAAAEEPEDPATEE